MEMKLKQLTLNHFKGIKHFELVINGHNATIHGDNATGKTSIIDAFQYLLFDKDSNNKKDFGIKTLDENNKEIHNLEHEVEGVFDIDGKNLTLKKLFKEKWTKKSGSTSKTFSGHTTDYFIDGVPSKKKEFTEKVNEIVSEDVFKLLTSPSYFNKQLHWEERRKTLLEISGDVTNEQVAEGNKDLQKLLDLLNGRDVEDHKKVIAAKRREINKELENIPTRVDEINRGLPDLQGLNKTEIDKQIEGISKQLESKQDQINDMKNGSEVNKKKAQISDIELQISKVKNEHANNGQQEICKLQTKLQEEQSNVNIIQPTINSKRQQFEMNKDYIDDLIQRRDDLRSNYDEKDKQAFDHSENCSCPTCGQDLPAEQQEEIKTKFNSNKSQMLETIKAKGVEANDKIKATGDENQAIADKIGKLEQQITDKQNQVTKLETKIKDLQSNVQPIEDNTSYQKLMQDRQAIEQDINGLNQSVNESVQKVQTEVAELKGKQRTLNIDLSKFVQVEQSEKRIAELEAQEESLAKEYEELEHQSHLIAEFTKKKVDLLEDKINAKFKYARFKLFKENINGGVEPTCETIYNGVEYSKGLNNAARINVGLDIIDTLSEHYGVQAPIFVDNAESITKLIDIDSQIISLVVSEQDKDLRIENVKEMELV